MADHVHTMIATPPKYVVSEMIGCTKGKGVFHRALICWKRKMNFMGQLFWVRGSFVSMLGWGEEVVREYIR